MTPFHALHQSGLLILPNVWDGASAAIVREAGARALATTSAGLAWAMGWPDGDVLPVDRLVQATADIVRAARGLPVSVDMEGGYSDDPAEVAALAKRLVETGAQGVNIEDGGGTPEALAARIAAIRAAVGDALFINARCDIWLRGLDPDAPVAGAARRAALYADAGADGFFAPGLADADDIAHMVAATPLPLNLMARPTLPDATALEALGVRRLSAGSGLAQATLGRAAALTKQFLADGCSTPLSDEALDYGTLNGWMS